jgi:hypothetical protein
LLRTIGFAQTLGVLHVLGIIPVLGGIIRFGVAIWVLIAGILAIRQALDVGTGKAILTAVLGWLVIVLPLAILMAVARSSRQRAAVAGACAQSPCRHKT